MEMGKRGRGGAPWHGTPFNRCAGSPAGGQPSAAASAENARAHGMGEACPPPPLTHLVPIGRPLPPVRPPVWRWPTPPPDAPTAGLPTSTPALSYACLDTAATGTWRLRGAATRRGLAESPRPSTVRLEKNQIEGGGGQRGKRGAHQRESARGKHAAQCGNQPPGQRHPGHRGWEYIG